MEKAQKSGFGIVGIIIIIAAVAILGGFFGYQYLKLPNIQEGAKAPAVEPPVTPSAQIQPQINEIDTSNWKTYRNEKYGFEVRYPEDYEPRDFLEKNKSLPWLQSTVLFIGVCRIEIGYDCDGGLVRVVKKGEFKQAWKSSKAFYRNNFIVEVYLPEEILSTFKFIPLEK